MTKRIISLILIFTFAAVALCSCAGRSGNFDPGVWGYDCKVIYDCLGGEINQRPVRTTYYAENSYLFQPAGYDGFLIEPIRDNYILAGWYTACEETAEKDYYNNTVYTFKAEDRWDFSVDRVTEDINLYAYWVPRSKAFYINADDGEKLFQKNIGPDSPISELSEAVVSLITQGDKTLLGYYSDRECKTPYDFSDNEVKTIVPDNVALYAELIKEFPDVLGIYAGGSDDETSVDASADTTQQFLNDIGYEYITDDEEKIAAVNKRKKEMIFANVSDYASLATSNNLYLKFIEGNYKRVVSIDSLKSGSEYSFDPGDKDGLVLMCDLDFSGKTFNCISGFSGTVRGNGYTIKNINIKQTVAKGKAVDKEGSLALFGSCTDATFDNIVFENISISYNAGKKQSEIDAFSGNSMAIGIVAGTASNVTLENCTFNDCKITVDEISLLPERKVTVGDVIGRDLGGFTNSGNTHENFTVVCGGGSAVSVPVLLAD